MDVASFEIDAARKRVYYTVNDGGSSRLRVLDARTLQPVRFPEMKEADQVILGSPSRDGRFVTVGMESAALPARGLRLRLADGDPHPVGAAERARGRPDAISRWRASRTTPPGTAPRSPCWCATPRAARPRPPAGGDPCPVVVHFHGGPEGQATARLQPLRAGLRRRRLHLRAAQRARQRRLRQDLARRRQRRRSASP